MHGKFLKYGSGSAHRANEYVLGNTDHKGDQRHQVLLIQGNPEIFAAVADSLDFKSRYKSYVAGFAKEDDPTIDEINEFVDEYKKTAFAGLEPDEYVFYAALHVDEDGKKDLHILSANVHLKTGKSLNIAPPNWQKTFDPLRDLFNNTKGWARPDDPNRARPFQRGAWHHSDKESAKDQIHEYLMQCFNNGLIDDRSDVINLLSEIGTITRQGEDYISLKVEGEKKAFRFKGDLYGKQFNSASWLEIAKQTGQSETAKRNNVRARESITPEHEERARAAQVALESARTNRAAYNKKRYKNPNQENIEMVRDNTSVFIDFTNSNCIFIQPDESRKNINNGIGGNNDNGGRENIQNIPFQQYETLQNKRNDNKTLSGEINDRARNNVIAELEAINSRIRKSSGNMAESISRFEESKRGLDEAISEAGNALHALMRTAKDYLAATKNIVYQAIENIKFFKGERHEITDVLQPEVEKRGESKPHPFKGRF